MPPTLPNLEHAATLARSHGWTVDRFDPRRNPPGLAITPCPNCGAYDAIIEHDPTTQIISVRCRGCDNPDEIIRLLYSPNGHTPNTSLTQLDIRTLLANPPPTHQWVWDGYIERRTLTVLHGDGGTGKSILAGHLARAITTGGNCLGRPTTQGNVLIIDAENPLDEITRRLHALDYHTAPTDRIAYYRASDPILGNTTTVDVELLSRIIEVHASNVAILDSQRGVWAGDEREATEIRVLYRKLQATAENLDCANVIIHHDRRTGSFSGSSDIHNSADTRLHLERPEPEQPQRILRHAKARSSAELPAQAYTFTFDTSLGLFSFSQPREPITDYSRVRDSLSATHWYTAHELAQRAGIRIADIYPYLHQLTRDGIAEYQEGPESRSAKAKCWRNRTPTIDCSQTREQSGTVDADVPPATVPPTSPPPTQ